MGVLHETDPPGFSTVLPLQIEYDSGRTSILLAMNDSDEQVITQQLRARPRKVTLGAGHSLLAKIRRE